MEIKRKPLKFYLEKISIKENIVIGHSLKTCLNILESCDERGNFPSGDPDTDLGDYGPSQVTKLYYRSEELRDETEEDPSATLTFQEYIALGKPEVISEIRSIEASQY